MRRGARVGAALVAGVLGAVLAAALAPAGIAHADPLTDANVVKADQLFTQGRELLSTNLIQACAKFDESLRFNAAAIGTVLNVALCHEKLGRVASAFARFTEARQRAIEQGLPEHVRAADEHLAILEPLVPHVAITLTELLPNTSVQLDDRVIALDALDRIAVDPGERVISVSAPGRLPYRTTFVIEKATRKDVVVPALAKSITITSSGHRIGQITTITGVVAAGTGLGIGIFAWRRYRAEFDNHSCTEVTGGKFCSPEGLKKTQSAQTLGNVGTIVGAAGLAITGVGLYLWLRSPSSRTEHPPAVVVVPDVSPDSVGLAAIGRF